MKRCPFCAEEIMEEAIKCRFCGSWLSNQANPQAAVANVPPVAVVTHAAPGQPAHVIPVPPQNAVGIAVQSGPARSASTDGGTLIYEGSPSWKSQFRQHFLSGLGGLVFFSMMMFVRSKWTTSSAPIFAGLIALVGVAGFYLFLYARRKATHYRITDRSIDIESGLFSKNIETMQLWKVRDIEYFQTLADRILDVSTVRVVAHDVTTPDIKLWGLPENREIFRKFKNAIELSRQGRNVIGMVD